MSDLHRLPSVERLLQSTPAAILSQGYGRPLTLRAIQMALAAARERLLSDRNSTAPEDQTIVQQAEKLLEQWTRARRRRVINATGVILHTNLGRAPLSRATLEAMTEAAQGYLNLEFDLESGKRGTRGDDPVNALRTLTGAEAALVVNNNAAAVLLVLTALASRRRVAIARTQLVEIGGGFRMPDVMRQSGARLVEVGTTNKVRLQDYTAAFTDTAVVLWVNRSNFKLVGFTEEPHLRELIKAAHTAGQTVIVDLGSGALLDTAAYGLEHEPMVKECLEAGADVVCFSGDKLVGGPQAGLIVATEPLLMRIRRHPLARAIRADKVTLAGIAATLTHYLKDEAEREVPVWQMISCKQEALRARSEAWQERLKAGEVIGAESTLGGGSLPGEALPTYALALTVQHPETALARLRHLGTPIIARVEQGRILLDPRTVQPDEDEKLLAGLRTTLKEMQ